MPMPETSLVIWANLVDRPTQLICISDIYYKYKRHSRVICQGKLMVMVATSLLTVATLSTLMSATMFDSMMATVSGTTMSSQNFVRAQRG